MLLIIDNQTSTAQIAILVQLASASGLCGTFLISADLTSWSDVSRNDDLIWRYLNLKAIRFIFDNIKLGIFDQSILFSGYCWKL